MAKRESQSSNELMAGDFAPLTSPFATKIPRKVALAAEVPQAEKEPLVSRKRKRSVSPEEKRCEGVVQGVVVPHIYTAEDPYKNEPSSRSSSPRVTITECVDLLSGLEIEVGYIRDAGTFTVPHLEHKLPLGVTPDPEIRIQESDSESDGPDLDDNDGEDYFKDEDDSNDEDNWRNEYPDDDDDVVIKRDTDDDGGDSD